MDQIGRLNAAHATGGIKKLDKVAPSENLNINFKTNSMNNYGFYPGLELSNKGVPQYKGPESMGNFLDYLVNNDIL